MVRYSIAAASLLTTLSSRLAVEGHENGEHSDAWSFLTATLPSPLSDMSVAIISTGEGDNEKKRIVLTGGCDDPDGNVFKDKFGGIFECASLSDKAYAFDPIHPHSEFQAWTGEFKSLEDMPRKRARHASVVVDGNVCVFGGRNETDFLIAEVDCYDPSSDEWTVPTSLPEKYQTSDHTAFVAEGSKVYLVGGWDQDYVALDQVIIVDMSDPDAVSYSEGPSLQARRGDIDIAVLDNGDAYVSGGFTDENNYDSPLNSVERFRPSVNKWGNVPSLNAERGDKQLVAMNGRVYAIGGEDKVDSAGPTGEQGELGARSAVLDDVEVLDPSEDVHAGLGQWKTLAGMPGQLFRFAAAGWDADERGYIFVFGGQVAYESGCKCFKTTDKVMVFDVTHAELGVVSPGSVAGGSVWKLSFALAGLLWLAL